MRTVILLMIVLFIAGVVPRVAAGQGAERSLATSFEGGNAGEQDDRPWWGAFEDPHLTSIIGEALSRNHDVAAALARSRVADAQVMRSAAPLMPSVTLDGTVSGSPSASLGFQFAGLMGPTSSDIPTSVVQTSAEPEMPDVILNTSATVSLRYQVDLWGQATNAYRATQLLRDSTRAEGDRVAVALTIQVGQAYFDAVAARQQADIVRRQIELNQSLVDLLQLRFDNDQASASDVLQQRQQVAAARARLPQARAGLRAASQRLALLLARPTWRAGAALDTANLLPALSALPATGRPTDLAESRPELRALRDRLEAARRQERSARRAMLPTLGLSGSAGYQGFRSTEYRDQSTWGFGVTISVPAFRGLSDWAAIREAQANVDAAQHSLEQSTLVAVSEVEGALAMESEQREQLEAYRALLEAARQAFEMSRASYVAGVGNYLQILAGLGALQAAELTVLQSERALINARLQLHLALGGRWTAGLSRSGRRGER